MNINTVTLFNQLTHGELADISKFEYILSHHYEKFKYVCRLLQQLKVSAVDKLCCTELNDTRELIVELHFDRKKDRESLELEMGALLKSYVDKYAGYFALNMYTNEKKILCLAITCQEGIACEEDIYADRPYLR